jgi:hypothetical protein
MPFGIPSSKLWNLDTVKRPGYVNPLNRKKMREKESRFDSTPQEAWKEDVTDRIERSAMPDVDTGFQYIEIGEDYDVDHEALGAVPTRAVILFALVEDPKEGVDNIYRPSGDILHNGSAWSGMQLIHQSTKKTILRVAATYCYSWAANNWTEGYARVMMWR